MKYFVFSIDDGTLYDEKVIDLFNKYGICGTFNLNSGLNRFVWYLEDQPIERFNLEDVIDLYNGHEVASHSLTHPYLDSKSDEEIIYEINEDITNLERIFNREVVSFATPFETCGEREVNVIRYNSKLTNIRMSEIEESFKFPLDPFHIKITAMDIDRALDLFEDFKKDKNAELFVYAGHSYDFFVPNYKLDKLEELICKIKDCDDIQVITINKIPTLIK